MITLVLESSTYQGSVALLRAGELAGERNVAMRGAVSEALMPAVAELLVEHRVKAEEIGRVICGSGPGAFTSLRIAGGIAKGLAMAVGAELVPISSLALLIASREPFVPGRYLATMDAMRGEWFAEPYVMSAGGGVQSLGMLRVVSPASLTRLAAEMDATIAGGEGDTQDSFPRARGAARMSETIEMTASVDLASWEPAYGRLAEAQVKWEAEHGIPLASR